MNWFPIVVALLIIIIVREFRLRWLPSTYAPGSRPAISNPAQATPSSDAPSDSPHPFNVPKEEVVGQLTSGVVARPERNEPGSYPHIAKRREHADEMYYVDLPENFQTPTQAFTFPSAQGFFNHAHDLTLYQPVMYNVNETREKGRTMFSYYAVFSNARGSATVACCLHHV